MIIDVPRDAPRARYALATLLALLGVDSRDAQPGEQADVGYGRPGTRVTISATPARDWDNPVPQLARIGGVPVIHLGPPPANVARIDLLYAAYASLTAPWERVDPADEVGCPLGREGWLARNGLLHEPLVHRYAELLARALGVDPPHREPLVVLTHDIDNNWRHLFGVRERAELLRRDLGARRPHAVRRAAGLAREIARRPKADPGDRFDDWAAWHAEWGGRPAFFVASYGLFRAGSDRRDVPYDVRHPEVGATLRRLAADGAEIGVHLSFQARASAGQLRRERGALAEVLGAPVLTARHHWLALDRPAEKTLRLHADAGLELDCSLGYNDCAGFRRGIAAPFHPFDHETEGPLAIWELPTIAMDAALFHGRSRVDALAELRSLHKTVSGAAGALVLDWHVHAADPAALNGAGAGLRAFLGEARATLATPLEAVEAFAR
ncbi:MAG: hypothetical protein ABI990_00750 [Actinomycetota bacterium]